MSFELTGKICHIEQVQQVSDKFKRREFVIETTEEINGKYYTNYAKMQLVQIKCAIIDGFYQGDTVKVQFNIKGNKWQKDGKTNYITTLDAWRVEKVGGEPSKQGVPDPNNAPVPNNDDLPF